MASEQKGFVVYGDIKESLDELTDEQVATLFRGMVDYHVTGKEPKFKGVLKFVFIPIKQQMDRNTEKYEQRCERNRANANKRWNGMQSDAIAYGRMQSDANGCDNMRLDAIDANTNTNTNTNTKTDTDTTTMSAGTDVFSLSRDLIDYLNSKAGTSHKADGGVTAKIQFLLNNGYTPLQLRTVIDKQCAVWLGDEKMRQYLRPSTLFGDKFGEYLAAPIPLAAERQKKAEDDRATLERQLGEKREALASLQESLKGASKEERKLLRENIAILEDSISLIERRLS